MGEVRFAVWNVEWMNDLFTGDDPPVFKPDDKEVRGPRKKNTVLQRRNSLAAVVNDIEVDALVVVEGPNRASELQLFFDHSLVQGDWKCDVQPVKGGKSLTFLKAEIQQKNVKNLFGKPPYSVRKGFLVGKVKLSLNGAVKHLPGDQGMTGVIFYQ